MIVEPPHKQHPTVQKLGLNVQEKLEEATMEAMSTWFNDPDRPENAAKTFSKGNLQSCQGRRTV